MGGAKVPPPPGVKALNISNKQMEKYALKTGPGRKDVLGYKTFIKEEMLDEVLKMGFYSAWNDIKADVQAYDGTEMLVVADLEEKYGVRTHNAACKAAAQPTESLDPSNPWHNSSPWLLGNPLRPSAGELVHLPDRGGEGGGLLRE
jgi:hypothetical protein